MHQVLPFKLRAKEARDIRALVKAVEILAEVFRVELRLHGVNVEVLPGVFGL